MTINTLCFSGAGAAGISFVSSLKYLCDIKYIEQNKINTFVGCSFGAILSFFLIIGYSIDELYIFCMEFNFDILKSNIYIKNIINNGCINSSENIMYLIKKFFFNKFNIYDCTLKELFDMTKKKIIIMEDLDLEKLKEEMIQETRIPYYTG
jgi:predicted acylesterase/phospholipase RssA